MADKNKRERVQAPRATSSSPSLARRASASLLVLAFILICLVGYVSAPVLAESPDQDAPAAPGAKQVAEGLHEGEIEEAEEETVRATVSATEEREESLEAFTDLSSDEAKALLQAEFTEQLAWVNQDPARMLSDASIDQMLTPTAARITADGNTMLLDGTMPVRVPAEDGGLSKVDLDLVSNGQGFSQANPLVPLYLPSYASDGVMIGGDGLSVKPVLTDGARIAQHLGDKDLFYPETQTDTDMLAMPMSSGVELFSQLRSVQSPEELRFDLTLPSGAELRPSGEGGAEVVDEDQVLARVPAPKAIDAQGAEVPVQMSIEGNALVLGVPHRSMDVAYPLLVDPAIAEDWATYGSTSWYGGSSLASLENSTWAFTSSDYGRYKWGTWPIYRAFGGSNRGLFISATNINETQWAYRNGQWSYTVPGQSTYITAAGVNPFWRDNHGCDNLTQYPEPHDYIGLWSPYWSPAPQNYGWMYFQKDAAQGYGYAFAEPPHDWRQYTAQVFIVGLGNGVYNTAAIPCWRDIYVGGAYVWLDDVEQPSLATSSTDQWMDKTPVRLNVSAADPGLGVKSFTATATTASGSSQTWTTSSSCSGLRANPCPASWNLFAANQPSLNYDPSVLPEGVDTLSVTAYDATQKLSKTTNGMTIRVDHGPPSVSFSGSLTEQAKLGTTRPSYKVHLSATDGSATQYRSGAIGFVVKVDGAQIDKYWPGDCQGVSCAVWADYTLESAKLAVGHHTMTVEASDEVGRVGTQSLGFDIARDKTAPSVAVSGELAGTSKAPVGPFATVTVVGTDVGTGVTSLKVKVDGASVEEASQPCPDGACQLTKTVEPNLMALPSGTHVIEFVVTDGAGNLKVESRQFVLDSAPPEIKLSGELAEADGNEPASRYLGLMIEASDSGAQTTGIVRTSIEVDDQSAKSWQENCSIACPLAAKHEYVFDQQAWAKGGHMVYIVATDKGGNQAVEALGVGYPKLQGAQPTCPQASTAGKIDKAISPEEALMNLKATVPAAVGPIAAAVDEATDTEVAPELAATEPDFAIKGTLPGGEVSRGWVGVTVGSATCVVPASESESATEPLLASSSTAVYANTANDRDAAIRSTALGALLIDQLRSLQAVDSITWKVALQPGQKLVELPSGAAAIVESPTANDTGPKNDVNSESTVSPGELGTDRPAGISHNDLLSDAGAQLDEGRWQLESAQEATEEQVVAVVAMPWVRDAAGQEIPAYLSVAADTITINFWEPETEAEEDDWDFPLVVMSEMSSTAYAGTYASDYGFPGCLARARTPYLRKFYRFIAGELRGPYYVLGYGGGMYCYAVQSAKITVEIERHRAIVGVIDYWDTIGGWSRNEAINGHGGLALRKLGNECESTPTYHSFRTTIQGFGFNTTFIGCLSKIGGCETRSSDSSATGRYRCANG